MRNYANPQLICILLVQIVHLVLYTMLSYMRMRLHGLPYMYDLIEDRCIDDVTINNILLLHCKNKEIPRCRESVLLKVTEDVKMC